MKLCAAVLLNLALRSLAAQPKLPNIIFFLTDDQVWLRKKRAAMQQHLQRLRSLSCLLSPLQDVEMGSLSFMPTVQSALMDEGTTFTRMYAHVPVCCPSRSALISGQYMHNNGCRGNAIASNCSSPSWQQGPETRSYVTQLAAAGYKTSFAGKCVPVMCNSARRRYDSACAAARDHNTEPP
jgi:arylsulfatase A-like enzyme